MSLKVIKCKYDFEAQIMHLIENYCNIDINFDVDVLKLI